MARLEHGERAQDVGVALARDEMPDGDERLRGDRRPSAAAGPRVGVCASLGRRVRVVAWQARSDRKVGSEVDDARLARAVCTRELGDAVAVGEHEAGGMEAASDCTGSGVVADGRVEDVAAVYGDDDGAGEARPSGRVAGRHGVVRMDEVEWERAVKATQGDGEGGGGPGSPRGVGAIAGGRDVGDIADGQAVAGLRARLAQQLGGGGSSSARPGGEGRAGGHEAVQDEHAHVGAGIARGERLAMRPDPQHGIALAGVELGDDGDPGRALPGRAGDLRRALAGRAGDLGRAPARAAHQWRWVASVSAAWRALR